MCRRANNICDRGPPSGARLLGPEKPLFRLTGVGEGGGGGGGSFRPVQEKQAGIHSRFESFERIASRRSTDSNDGRDVGIGPNKERDVAGVGLRNAEAMIKNRRAAREPPRRRETTSRPTVVTTAATSPVWVTRPPSTTNTRRLEDEEEHGVRGGNRAGSREGRGERLTVAEAEEEAKSETETALREDGMRWKDRAAPGVVVYRGGAN